MTAAQQQPAGLTRGLAAAAALALLALVAGPQAGAQPGESGDTAVIDGLMWSVTTNGEDVPWEPAREYCETLELAGHQDWRLPTLTEVESLHDPAASAGNHIRSPLVLDACCLWSSTSLAELPPDEGGARGGQGGDPGDYYWGFLFPGGVRYYSVNRFPDGQALCVREIS